MDSKTIKAETPEEKPTQTEICHVCGDDSSSSHSMCEEMAPVIARRLAKREARLEQERQAKKERRD